MQRHDWSSTSPKGPMLHLSLSPCTGDRLLLASSSRHWCSHIEQPQAQHPPTSTHYYESISPPEVWDLRASLASSAIRERHKITLQNVFIYRSWLVEWTSHLHPEPWIPDSFQATPENSSLPSSLDFFLKKKAVALLCKIFKAGDLDLSLSTENAECTGKLRALNTLFRFVLV